MFTIVVTDLSEVFGCGTHHTVNHAVGPFQSCEDAMSFLEREGFAALDEQHRNGSWTHGKQHMCWGNQPEDEWDMPSHSARIVEMRSPSESFCPVMLR